VKGNANRQDHSQDRQSRRFAKGVQSLFQGVQKEVGILEVDQESQIGDQAREQKEASPRCARRSLHATGNEIIHSRRDTNNQSEPFVPARVEIKTRSEQQPNADTLPRQRPVTDKDNGEEDEKLCRTEKHRVPALQIS